MGVEEITTAFNETITVINEMKEKYVIELNEMTTKLNELTKQAATAEVAVKKKLELEKSKLEKKIIKFQEKIQKWEEEQINQATETLNKQKERLQKDLEENLKIKLEDEVKNKTKMLADKLSKIII